MHLDRGLRGTEFAGNLLVQKAAHHHRQDLLLTRRQRCIPVTQFRKRRTLRIGRTIPLDGVLDGIQKNLVAEWWVLFRYSLKLTDPTRGLMLHLSYLLMATRKQGRDRAGMNRKNVSNLLVTKTLIAQAHAFQFARG